MKKSERHYARFALLPSQIAAMDRNEKRPVVMGSEKIADAPVLTYWGALRMARQLMPRDLARAGFTASIFVSDPEINGGTFYRINYGKRITP